MCLLVICSCVMYGVENRVGDIKFFCVRQRSIEC